MVWVPTVSVLTRDEMGVGVGRRSPRCRRVQAGLAYTPGLSGLRLVENASLRGRGGPRLVP